MHDPFPLARPAVLVPYVEKISEYLALQTLPLHFHEVIVAYAVYHTTNKYISPALSQYFFPRTYSSLNARTKLNWDVHVVSFVQSVVVCSLALWVMWADTERQEMDTKERVHGYTGASGLIQAFAGGYFLWDLVITAQNVKIFGIGMLFHALSALCVFSLGFVSALMLQRECREGRVLIMATATLCQLLCVDLYPLRTLFALPEHSLVLRQTQHDWLDLAVPERHCSPLHILLMPPVLGNI